MSFFAKNVKNGKREKVKNSRIFGEANIVASRVTMLYCVLTIVHAYLFRFLCMIYMLLVNFYCVCTTR